MCCRRFECHSNAGSRSLSWKTDSAPVVSLAKCLFGPLDFSWQFQGGCSWLLLVVLESFLLFALGCQVSAVPCFLCLCSIPINYLFFWLSFPSVSITPSNGEIVLYPSSLVSHKKFLVCTEEAALYVIQSNNRAAEWAESLASQPLCSHTSWQELTRRRMRERRDFLQVGDVCVTAECSACRAHVLLPVRCG